MMIVKTILYILGVIGLIALVVEYVRRPGRIAAALAEARCELCEGPLDEQHRCLECGRRELMDDAPALEAQAQQLREVCQARRCLAQAASHHDGAEYEEANLRLAEAAGHLRDLMRTRPDLAAGAVASVPNADATPAVAGFNLTLSATELSPLLGALTGLGVLAKAAVDGTLDERPKKFRAELQAWDEALAELRHKLATELRHARRPSA